MIILLFIILVTVAVSIAIRDTRVYYQHLDWQRATKDPRAPL